MKCPIPIFRYHLGISSKLLCILRVLHYTRALAKHTTPEQCTQCTPLALESLNAGTKIELLLEKKEPGCFFNHFYQLYKVSKFSPLFSRCLMIYLQNSRLISLLQSFKYSSYFKLQPVLAKLIISNFSCGSIFFWSSHRTVIYIMYIVCLSFSAGVTLLNVIYCNELQYGFTDIYTTLMKCRFS